MFARHTLEEDVGQMLLVGFDGTELPDDVREDLQAQRVSGVVLFARNLPTPGSTAALNASIYAASSDPLLPFIAVDQEGGAVQRIREPATRIPPMRAVGTRNSTELAARIGEVLGDELEALGFNLNFAPCVDVDTNPANPVIGDRSFGADPALVSRMAGSVALGLLKNGIIPCAKHFPGHGDTRVDSHLDLPVVDHPAERLQQVELEPFRQLVRIPIPMIMTAHLLVPAVDARWPATLSNAWVTGVLRRELKYGGVVVSDDLEMKAIADRFDATEIAERGLHAGLDLFLVCRSRTLARAMYDALVAIGGRSEAEREMIAIAAGRIRKLKKEWLRPWTPPEDLDARLGSAAAAEVVARVLTRPAEEA